MELVVVVRRSGDRGHALDHGHAGGRRVPVAVVIVVVAVGVALAVVVGFEATIRQREGLATTRPRCTASRQRVHVRSIEIRSSVVQTGLSSWPRMRAETQSKGPSF
jgi:hypothetical protein